MIRHAGLSVSPLTVDHPGQRISSQPCHEQREQWVLCHTVAYGSLPLANIPLGLRVAFACLIDKAATLVVCVSGGPGGAIRHVLQGFAQPDPEGARLGPDPVRLAGPLSMRNQLPDPDDQA
jgi:hypothetical protein